jgi:hypothetical protein
MLKQFIQLSLAAIVLAGLALMITQSTSAQTANPTPSPLNRPDYNYSESNGCTSCHFSRGAGGDHMPEAVGVKFDDTTKAFVFTGSGWRSSTHSQTNYKSTQNTYCAKCHSPLQAKTESTYKNGVFKNTDVLAEGKVEGVTCAACHPSHNAAVVLGRRLGVYKFGMNKATPEAYDVVQHGEEDQLCLNCHVSRHNEDNAAFMAMYSAGVKCIDCHMAPYDFIVGTEIEKRFHDFKVGKNLPYSCGVEGSMTHCHPEFTAEATLAFLPMFKQQHTDWFPMKNKTKKAGLTSSADYMKVWRDVQAEYVK